MRAGLKCGVQVRVGQDLDDPTTITIRGLNPADRKPELEAHLSRAQLALMTLEVCAKDVFKS